MINFYPNSILTPDAYLRMGQTFQSLVDGPQYDQASAVDASTYYQDYLILYPKEPDVAKAEKGLDEMKTERAQSKIKMAEFYHFKRHNYVAAKIFYNEASTIYPNSPVARWTANPRQDRPEERRPGSELAARAARTPSYPSRKRKGALALLSRSAPPGIPCAPSPVSCSLSSARQPDPCPTTIWEHRARRLSNPVLSSLRQRSLAPQPAR
jgi:outer membrane protein assembly factor BamD